MIEKKKQVINKKNEEDVQEYLSNGLVPPMNLSVNFKPSPKQYELWKCLEPNSCNKCGGAIVRVPTKDESVVTGFIPACEKCGNKDIPQVILGGGAAGGGKMLNYVKSVITPNGEVKTKDLKIGDEICSSRDSKTQKVIALHPLEEHEFFLVEFEDGTSTECSEGHLWSVWQTRKRNGKIMQADENGNIRCNNVMETRQLYEWMLKKRDKGMYTGCNLKIPLTDPVCFTKYEDKSHRPIPSYVLGVILGDGCITASSATGDSVVITNGDEFVANRIEAIMKSYGGTVSKKWEPEKNYWTIRVSISGLTSALKNLNLFGCYADNKFIPDVYKYSPIEERFKLMQGLMDTDGYVDERGHMEYCSASPALSNDVAYVVRSLGSYATVTIKKDPKYTYNGEQKSGADSHRVYIRSPHATKMVSLPRKKDRCTDDYNGGKSPFGKVITNITPIGRQTSRCITVSDASGEYLTDDFTVTHNSYVGCYWILFNCFRFAKIKAVIARKTLKSLEASTWATLRFIINDELGLIEKVHYREDKVKGVIMFWNGSSITKQELELLPSDPTYQRLGSNEYTIAFVDEVGEIAEKGVEVLYSRLRWRVAETFKVPKIFLSTNPVANWVRDRFVQDNEGDPVTPRRGDIFIQFSVFDNPKDDFVQIYASSLSNLRDEKEKLRLLYGNWDFLESSENVIYNQFNGEVHIVTNLKKTAYNPLLPLILIYDFNVIPQMSVLVAQVDYDTKKVYILDEISGTPKDRTNSTPAVTRVVAKYIKSLGHTGGVVVSGDSTGAQRSAASEVDVNNYTIIRNELLKAGIKSTQNVMTKNPPHKTRTEFINLILQGNTAWSVQIDLSCRKLTSDLMYQEKNPDGTKCKKKVIDPETGMKYEKYGHFSDNLDYLMCTFLPQEWAKYIDGDLGESYSPNAIFSYSPKSMFRF